MADLVLVLHQEDAMWFRNQAQRVVILLNTPFAELRRASIEILKHWAVSKGNEETQQNKFFGIEDSLFRPKIFKLIVMKTGE